MGVETGMCGCVGVAVGVEVGGRVTPEVGVDPYTSPLVASCVGCIAWQQCCHASGCTRYNGERDGGSQRTERRWCGG
jgi:hypothetical protein